MINVTWSNNLEKLAEAMAGNLANEKASSPEDIFARKHCVVIPNKSLQSWFQHNFLYRDSPSPQSSPPRGEEGNDLRVLANIEYPLLHVFVNDWLHKMLHPDEKRDPSEHPFAHGSLQWRIYSLLSSDIMHSDARFAPLTQYIESVGSDPSAIAQRRFTLSGDLASLFDDYQVYRPEMMLKWQQGKDTNAEEKALLWQPELWRQLTLGELADSTYLSAFWQMDSKLAECNITRSFPAIHVFGVSMMPRVYTVFFHYLSKIVPTYFYLLNPCSDQWDEALTPREAILEEQKAVMQGTPDDNSLLVCNNPLLGSMGRGCRDFLGNILDMTGGQVDDIFTENSDSLLGRIQQGILDNSAMESVEGNSPSPQSSPPRGEEDIGSRGRSPSRDGEDKREDNGGDESVQLHICHSPMREVEVLRDQLLRRFAEDSTLQPRHIQVQVTDMALYAPYIDAVFSTHAMDADSTIPYAIADRVSVGESAIGEAFTRLLNISDSRFSAPEVVELLQCESVHQAFGMEEQDIETVQSLVSASGVRWGRDKSHRQNELNVEFTEQTTWRHGLDRLMLGYAITDKNNLTDKTLPLPCDKVEGDEAIILGQLARFFDCLQNAADKAALRMTPEQWAEHLNDLIDTFFISSNDNYNEIAALRALPEMLVTSCRAAEFAEAVPVTVVRDFISGQLSNSVGGRGLTGNSVVFGTLRTGATAPRRMICMLGMGDGLFPRSDNRPAYDLFRRNRHRGDPSLRIEDRMAFLEAIVSAGEYLHISYVGRTVKENESVPPSTALSELIEYAEAVAGKGAIPTHHHKLQPFHPDYFDEESPLFSYDVSNCNTAKRIVSKVEEIPVQKQNKGTMPDTAVRIELDELIRFFKNPARKFYRDVLKARLDPPDDGGLEENEEFSPSGLAGYAVNDAIITALRAGTDQDDVYHELAEQGKVPLEQWGRKWFAERWLEISEVLEQDINELGTLAELLETQQPVFDDPVEVAIGSTLIAGNVNGREQEDTVLAVDFRCVSAKATDKFSSWIRHLFACAAGKTEQRLCVLSKKADDMNISIYPASSQEDAVEHLTELVDAYFLGHASVCAFAPATSFSYANGWKSAKIAEDLDDDEIEQIRNKKGTDAARKSWFSGHMSFGDDQDPYFQQGFGTDGPFDTFMTDDFNRIAKMLFIPMLDSAERGKG